MTASEHRARARSALAGKWGNAALTTLVLLLVSFGINAVTTGATAVAEVLGLILSLAVTLVTSVIGLGYLQYALNLVDRKETGVATIFSRFDLLWPAFRVSLLTTLVIVAPTVLWLIVGTLLTMLLGEFGAMVMGLGAFALYVVMIVLAFGLSMANYVLLDVPGITAREALRRSWEMMKGNKWRYFSLGFSFIGWALLGALTMGIGLLFVSPYMAVANASFYRELCPEVLNRTDAPPINTGDDEFFRSYYKGDGT